MPPPTASSTPHPQTTKNKTTYEDDRLRAKWTVEENRLGESWINASTNPITGTNHKKLEFWSKVALVYNRYASDGTTKRMVRFTMPIGTRLHYWYPNGPILWGRHTE